MDAWGFERPEFLVPAVLLAAGSAIALLVGLGRRSGGDPETRRRLLVVACRLLTLALLAVMMSAPTHRGARPRKAAVAFVVDAAQRLGTVRGEAYDFVEQAIGQLPEETRVGVRLAADAAVWLETPGTPVRDVNRRRWSDEDQATVGGALAAAVDETARHLAPGDILVLLTDGRSDRRALLPAARRLRQKGIATYVHPVTGEGRSEVLLENVAGPVLVREGDQATFRVAFRNSGTEPTSVDLGFELRVEGEASVQFPPLEGFRCEPGRCVAEYRMLFSRPGNAWLGVTLGGGRSRRRGPEDLREAWFPCMVRPTPEILVVAGMPGAADFVIEALRARGAEISGRRLFETDPAGIPDDPEALERYGAITLVNVEASALTAAQNGALRRYVAELGGGLVTFGGIHAFDRGGYAGSELEALLPVDSRAEPPERKQLGFGILFVIDVSGSVAGELGATKSSIEHLVRSVPLESTIGIVVFDAAARVDRALAPVGTPAERDRLLGRVHGLSGGGGTILASGLDAAIDEILRFKAEAPSGHASGHVVVLSDGDLENSGWENAELENLRRLARELDSAGWQVSCIGIGGPDDATLSQIALAGAGHYSAYPLIPRIGNADDPDAQFTYTLSAKPGEPVFGLVDHQPLALGSVTEFNRAEGLKPWAHESLLFDHRESPWGLAFGRLGRGTSVAALYDVTRAWSFPLLEGEFRDTLLARPILFSLREETGELHVPSLRREEDGRRTLLVEAADDTAPKLDVRLGSLPEKEGSARRSPGSEREEHRPLAEENAPIILELPRVRRHTYGAPLPAGVDLPNVLRVDIAPRMGRDGAQLPGVRLPLTPRPSVDVDRLEGSGPDHQAIAEFVQRANGSTIDDSSEIAAGMTPPGLPETRRFWGPCLAIAIILAVAADAAARTWRLQWPLVLYTAAGGFAALALFLI